MSMRDEIELNESELNENSSSSSSSLSLSLMEPVFKKVKLNSENELKSDKLIMNSNATNISANTNIINKTDVEQIQNKPRQFARKSTAPNINMIGKSVTQPQTVSLNNQPAQSTSTSTNVITNITNKNTGVKSLFSNGSSSLNQTITAPKSFTVSTPTNVNSSNNTNNLNSTSTSTCATNTTNTKQFRNKIVSCKPFCESKATECYPIMKDASTQIDLDEIKLTHSVVPVPVPINVPIPMCMYQAPMPVPLLIPVPIPVPVIIPTTKKTYDRVERKIKKLRKKLPSDPYEFEILLYAEKLAREEGIAGFEESSDGESEEESNGRRVSKTSCSQSFDVNRLNSLYNDRDQQHSSMSNICAAYQLVQSDHENTFNQGQLTNQLSIQQNETEGCFKWFYGVKVFNAWLTSKVDQLKSNTILSPARLPDDLLKLKNEELNVLLADFLREVRKPSGEPYAPESLYYLCLGIQHYLQEKGRTENIFLDSDLFDNFQEVFNEVSLRYQIRINQEGLIVSRIEEEILWESKQLGAYSPFVLLNTILYFNTKYFFLDKSEAHLQLSFANVKKHSKRNIGPNGEDYGKTAYLRYYPDYQGLEQVIYEQGENYENPLRCPVELYNFYLSKCPENVKNRSDVFYLLPEKASLPSSPVWFSSQPLSVQMLERMVNRVKMVKEVNELLLAATPTSTTDNLI